jgi:opacity protein-like surface antigen
MKFTKFTILFTFLFCFFLSNAAHSQIKTTSSRFKPASIIVELTFKYDQPLPNMYGDMVEFFQFKNYGVKYGTGAQINIKMTADKKGRIRPYLTLGYDLFLNSDKSNAFIPNNTTTYFPFTGDSTAYPVPGTSKMWLHDFNIGLGFEYAFINKTKWTPYLNLDLGMNIMFGTYRQNPVSVPPNQVPGEISFTINSATRFGVGVGAGVDGRVTRGFGITFGIKYRMPNLVGQDSKKSTEVNKFELNDQKNTSLNNNLTKNRIMSFLSFYLGAAFYIGRK